MKRVTHEALLHQWVPAKRIAIALSALLASSGCASVPPSPQPDALVTFSTTLLNQQPEDAFAAVFVNGDTHLVWIGARHSTRVDSPTFTLIREAFSNFDFDRVIIEGCPASWGTNPERTLSMVAEAAEEQTGLFQKRGEVVPAVMGALAQNADVVCGEPEDREIKRRVLQNGFSSEDVLGFYTLRSIPQWVREKRITDASDPRIVPLLTRDLERNRKRLALDESLLPTVSEWRSWYARTNGKPLDAEFSLQEVGPLSDGTFKSNAVAVAVSKARAEFQHELVVREVGGGNSVLVVFGASHLMIHKPALEQVFGAPALIGSGQPKSTFAAMKQ